MSLVFVFLRLRVRRWWEVADGRGQDGVRMEKEDSRKGIITPKDTTVNGRLNDAVAPTKYADLFYNVFADFLLLGSIRIDREVL
eukprot:scaffold6654_cov135-Skeletonema_menzelii.AAC.3